MEWSGQGGAWGRHSPSKAGSCYFVPVNCCQPSYQTFWVFNINRKIDLFIRAQLQLLVYVTQWQFSEWWPAQKSLPLRTDMVTSDRLSVPYLLMLSQERDDADYLSSHTWEPRRTCTLPWVEGNLSCLTSPILSFCLCVFSLLQLYLYVFEKVI